MTSTGELLLRILAGLGLFFFGIKLLGRNLRSMAGGPFRRVVKRVGSNLFFASLWGVLAGFLTQSGRTTTLILSSLVQGGILPVRMALPVVLWSNLGCTLIVFATLFPIDFFILFLIGAAGISLSFERPRSLVSASGATFGLALLLFGLGMISRAAGGFTEFAWFEDLLALTNSSLVLALALGFGLTMLAQSHMGIILITLAMAQGGFFDFEHAAMIILGTQLGSSGITAATGLHFRGRPRQLVIAQILFNLAGVALFLGWFLAGLHPSVPSPADATAALSPGIGDRLVAFVLALNGLAALFLLFLRKPFLRLCERFSPPSDAEELGRLEFLSDELIETPSTALVLGDKEQLRLLKRLPGYLDRLREKPALDGPPLDVAVHHPAFAEVARGIHAFQRKLAGRSLPPEDTESLLNQQNRQELLNNLEAACAALIEEFGHRASSQQVCVFRRNIVEALDTQILTAIAALEETDADEAELLLRMTADGSETMEGIRKDFLRRAGDLSDSDRVHILNVTRLFERATWSLHNFGKLLQRATGAG